MKQTPQATRILAELCDILKHHNTESESHTQKTGCEIVNGYLQLDTKGARIDVVIYFLTELRPGVYTSPIYAHMPRGWVWRAEARRGAPKPHLHMAADGTWWESANWMPLPGLPVNHARLDWEPLDYTSIACDMAELLDQALNGCLMVHRRYTPGQHTACTTCAQQIHCLANAKERPKKPAKKK